MMDAFAKDMNGLSEMDQPARGWSAQNTPNWRDVGLHREWHSVSHCAIGKLVF
jgi:hypothetical protein